MSAQPPALALPQREMFLVAEGARLSLANPTVGANARLVYTWGKGGFGNADAAIMASTVPVLDDPSALMQVMAWSEQDRSFHFFEREGRHWIWMGHSRHALDPRSRGRGPFMGHRNGGPVMKEFLFPWVHWNSTADSLPLEVLGDTDLGKHPAMPTTVSNAQKLEDMVRAGLARWTSARIAVDRGANAIRNPLAYGRQIVTTSSINLVSSNTVLARSDTEPIRLPAEFFFDNVGLKFLAAKLNVDQALVDARPFEVARGTYLQAAADLGLHVLAGPGGPENPGDTHFAFVVPSRAHEDQIVLQAVVNAGWISPKIALAMLMVDFSNPIFSPEREALAMLFPTTPVPLQGEFPLDAFIFDAASQSDAAAQPAVQQMLKNLATPPQELFEQRLAPFHLGVAQTLATLEGTTEVLKLACSRRTSFRTGSLRRLAEFEATMARLGQPVRP
jgi:hypothetical protein